jgi:phosphosulfolactate phosphohydrolase-like enzyme
MSGTISPGVFIALNIVRALSIIALLLVFATSILVLVDDVEAVNAFTTGNFNVTAFDTGNSDYIPYATSVPKKRTLDF